MNFRTKVLGAVLVALALCSALPALAVSSHDSTPWITHDAAFHPSPVSTLDSGQSFQQSSLPSHERRESSRLTLFLTALIGIGAAVTVTYKFPVSGTTAPTAAQAAGVQAVCGLINWLESDTLGLFTHNFGISTGAGFAGSQPSLLSFFPEVIITPVLNSGTVFPNIQIDYSTSTGAQLAFFKGSIAGTGGTVLLTVRRPHSLGQ